MIPGIPFYDPELSIIIEDICNSSKQEKFVLPDLTGHFIKEVDGKYYDVSPDGSMRRMLGDFKELKGDMLVKGFCCFPVDSERIKESDFDKIIEIEGNSP